MTIDAAAFVGQIPEYYDRGLGPVLFADYAADMARRVAASGAKNVLEIAAGTGIVSRQLRNLLPADARLTVSDLNAPMLEFARAKFDAGGNIAFRVADGAALPFEDGAFDAVVCQFGVMFFPDKEVAYREARRVLSPGGRYFLSVWDSFRYNRSARLAHETIASAFTDDPPCFYQVPYGHFALDPIKEELLDAGFTELKIEVLSRVRQVASIEDFARGLVFGNPLIDEIRRRAVVSPEALAAQLTEALGSEFGVKPCRVPMQAIFAEAQRL